MQATANNKKIFLSDDIGFVELLEVFGSDLTVVNAARVSFNKESVELDEKDVKLIGYLAKNKHVTPFFHPQLRFRIKMPIFLTREWYRHTVGFSRNEVSRRYVDSEPECFVPEFLRQRDTNIKQGSKSSGIRNNDDLVQYMDDLCVRATDLYQVLLNNDVCPEQARIILPQGMYTEFIETASLAGYARLVNLRDESHAQKEIQEYARIVSSLIEQHFPISWKALCEK